MKSTNFISHLAAAAIVTILAGLVYATVQQTYRTGANDPQLQLARDISNKIESKGTPGKWFDDDTIEISRSLSVFNTLYNDKNEPALSTGVLHGKLPLLPEGVFDEAKKNGENVFTWQPEQGVRVAIVLKSIPSSSYSFVAVGRSLDEVELREKNLRWTVLISWLLCMGVVIVHWIIVSLKPGKNANR